MTAQEDLETALRAENERMMQDHIRLCTALGLDADAHIDMLAEAAERLRAENEFLAATLHSETAIKVEYEVRIAELVAALDPFEPSDQALGSFEDDDTVEIRMLTGELLMAQPFAILRRAAAALSQKGEGDEPG